GRARGPHFCRRRERPGSEAERAARQPASGKPAARPGTACTRSPILTCGELWLERAAGGWGGSARSSARRDCTRPTRATPSAAARLVRARTRPTRRRPDRCPSSPRSPPPLAARAPRAPLAAAHRVPAVQALVASAVAHRDVPADVAERRVAGELPEELVLRRRRLAGGRRARSVGGG